MSIFAKITGIVLILIGVLVMIAGIITAINGVINISDMPGVRPFMGQMMTAGLSLALATAIFLQGLVVTAVGEVLYLLAQIAENTQVSRRMVVDRV